MFVLCIVYRFYNQVYVFVCTHKLSWLKENPRGKNYTIQHVLYNKARHRCRLMRVDDASALVASLAIIIWLVVGAPYMDDMHTQITIVLWCLLIYIVEVGSFTQTFVCCVVYRWPRAICVLKIFKYWFFPLPSLSSSL